ncbi:MAG: dihydropteroate synthase [Verrucomicrobiota bacterium]|jgi:dihydropteroate synthase
MLLRARQFEFVFPRPPLLMGVVNVTPDSFSDGGEFFAADRAAAHALQLAAEGADIIDVGGESSRPGAKPVAEEEELRRVIPVIQELAGKLAIPISIDTIKPAVARAALRAGAGIINDIAANREDEEMWRLAAETGAGYVLTHMRGMPETMQIHPVYEDVVAEVDEFFGERLRRLAACGVGADQVVLDVGIGFGKRLEDNLQLLARLRSFTKWERPLLLGASRKSFMGALLGCSVRDRLPSSLACACWAAQQGARIIRVHDVAATRRALAMTGALMERQTNGEHQTNRL